MKLYIHALVNPSDLLDKGSLDDKSIEEMPKLFIYNTSKNIDEVSSSNDKYSTSHSIYAQIKHEVKDYNSTLTQDELDNFFFTPSDLSDSEKYTFYHFIHNSESEINTSIHIPSDSDELIAIINTAQSEI
jgi:5-bromo-4-chloroindolyl phosphate hydrolysis protein